MFSLQATSSAAGCPLHAHTNENNFTAVLLLQTVPCPWSVPSTAPAQRICTTVLCAVRNTDWAVHNFHNLHGRAVLMFESMQERSQLSPLGYNTGVLYVDICAFVSSDES
jgi:hypothetical protein